MLLHRYGSLSEVYDLPADTGIALLQKAAEEEENELVHRQWTAQLPYMTKDNYISFSDYRDRVTGRNIDKRPTGVIVAELLNLQAEMESANDGNI